MTHTLYISDLDGTLLNEYAELSPYAREGLNAMMADGLHFTVATARSPASFDGILAGLKLRLPVGLLNGVLVYDPVRKQNVRVRTIPPETVKAIVEMLWFKSATGFMYELREDGRLMTYYETLENKPVRDFVAERVNLYGTSFRKYAFKEVSPQNILYICVLDGYEKIKSLREALSALPGLDLMMYQDNYNSAHWYLDIHNADASKGGAARFFREVYGYKHIVAFGDNINDLPLFEACDFKVAVAGAVPEVKAAADYVCGANTADGVVKWLEAHAI
jgi:hypothetical protein